MDLAGAAARRLRNGSVSVTSKLFYVHKSRNYSDSGTNSINLCVVFYQIFDIKMVFGYLSYGTYMSSMFESK